MLFTKEKIFAETFVGIPATDKVFYEFYKQHRKGFWSVDSIDFGEDFKHYSNLSDDERKLIKFVSVFFGVSDAIVGENCEKYFSEILPSASVKAFYTTQAFFETIHNETYSRILRILDVDVSELARILSISKSIEAKREFANKYFTNDLPVNERLVAFIFVEGIFFSASFCCLLSLKTKHKCPGITIANEYIIKDETLHWKFGALVSKTRFPLNEKRVLELAEECRNIEYSFIDEVNPNAVGDLTNKDLKQYVDYLLDCILEELGFNKKYNAKQPFPFMIQQTSLMRDNIFERKSTNYLTI